MAVLKAMLSGGKRRPGDFYPTPPLAVSALLPLIRNWGQYVWEPCCGDGALARVLRLEGGYRVIASDIADRGFGRVGVDFFKQTCPKGDALITNPPFNAAADFIEHAYEIGVSRMALLLKIDFWNANTRYGLFRRWTPTSVHPLLWRLDFTGAGRPHTNCMWCLWKSRSGAKGCEFSPLEKPIKVVRARAA